MIGLLILFIILLSQVHLHGEPVFPNTIRGSEKVNDHLLQIADYIPEGASYGISIDEIGRSQMGRPILMFTINGSGTSESDTGGIMIVARQHGDEPAGTRAAVELIQYYASGDIADGGFGLDGIVLRVVPIANPDGMDSFTRETANGADMNRDWQSRRLPETRAIASVISAYRPDVLLDLHELTPRDRESRHVVGIPPQQASSYLHSIQKAFADQGMKVRTQSREIHKTRALLHRYFAYGYAKPGFLVESRYTSDPTEAYEQRSAFHLTTIEAVIEQYQNSRTGS